MTKKVNVVIPRLIFNILSILPASIELKTRSRYTPMIITKVKLLVMETSNNRIKVNASFSVAFTGCFETLTESCDFILDITFNKDRILLLIKVSLSVCGI
jgi:hypothetical protein